MTRLARGLQICPDQTPLRPVADGDLMVDLIRHHPHAMGANFTNRVGCQLRCSQFTPVAAISARHSRKSFRWRGGIIQDDNASHITQSVALAHMNTNGLTTLKAVSMLSPDLDLSRRLQIRLQDRMRQPVHRG